MIVSFSALRVRCGNCFRWFIRQPENDPAYCSYRCGSDAQPDHCASSWAFTSLGDE